MPPLPPFECFRVFEVAARHGSFLSAANELQVTAPAVGYRMKRLETLLGTILFNRTRHGVTLTSRGQACLRDVQQLLTDFQKVIDRHQRTASKRCLTIVVVESVAERWLMPKLAEFAATRPDVTISLETDLLNIDPNRNDIDAWIIHEGESKSPNGEMTCRETLFEETLFPVCSPALLQARGQPRHLRDLHAWPLLYHLGWPTEWADWFAAQGDPLPDLSRASGFRLCSLVMHAAVKGLGVAIGRPAVIAPELQEGVLVPVFTRSKTVRQRCCLITATLSRRTPELQEFRTWILEKTAAERRDATVPSPRRPPRSSARRTRPPGPQRGQPE